MSSPNAAMPVGPTLWPPSAAWPPAVHTGVGALKAMAAQWQVHPADDARPMLVAVSGGADSLALAAIAAETQRTTGLSFGAIVVDHQLQDVTAKVAEKTAAICQQLGLQPVETEILDIADGGSGLEAAARQGRYDAFVRTAHNISAAGVLTAHTANDQAEQVLLGIARGSGLRSIAGIRTQRHHQIESYAPVRIGRPLLVLDRADTESVCKWAGMRYFQDPMNQDSSLARIRVRQHLLPALTDTATGLGPGTFSGLVNTATLAADDADVLEELAAEAYADLAIEDEDHISFSLTRVQELKPAILRRVVAIAVQHLGAPQPSAERLTAIQNLIFPPVGRASSAGPIQLEGHVSLYREKGSDEYAKLLVVRSRSSH